MPLVLVDDEVLGADEHTARSVSAARDRDEVVRAVVDWLAGFPRHVVESQVQLVEGEVLLRLGRSLSGAVLVGVGVIQLDRREHGVIQSAVQRGDVEGHHVGLVSLERG